MEPTLAVATRRNVDLKERCDLNGLLLEHVKYKNTSTSSSSSGVVFNQVSTTVEPTLCDRVVHWCTLHDVRIETVLQFVWHRVLHVYGSGSETRIGTVIVSDDERRRHGTATIVVDHKKSDGIAGKLIDALRRLESNQDGNESDQREAVDDADHLDSSLTIIASWSRNNCNVMDHFQQAALDVVVVFRPSDEQELNGRISGGRLEWIIRYDADQYDPARLRGLLEIVVKTIDELSLCNSELISVFDIDSVPDDQKHLLDKWNRSTDGDFPESLRINELFEQVVEKSADKPALTYNDRSMTYDELNKTSNRLAHYLHSNVGIKPEQFVALFLDKSELTIVTVLAVWKSGAAYVPIDPAFPDERVEFMLSDTGTQHVICNRKYSDRLRGVSSPYIDIIDLETVIDQLVGDHSLKIPDSNPQLDINSSQLAYASYTSGTTGVPKAIGKRHRQIVNSITDLAVRYDMVSKPEVVVLFSSYVFEPFLRQTLQALTNGHRLVIVDDDEKLDRTRFPEFLRRHGVTYLNGTASVLREFDYSICPSLERLILIGEQLTEAHYNKLRQTYRRRIINEYGFTESAFVTTVKFFDDERSRRTDRSIGRPVRNVKCYVLDDRFRQVPIGAVGELYIGGVGVSDGYVNRTELTRQRFVVNPFQTESERARGVNGRMYKTGDVARWLPNGEIEYLGRNDFQVKIRGVRIEPGEIESVTCRFPGVVSSVVVVKTTQQQQQQLVGYFVSSVGRISEKDIVAFLEKKLPRYMVPMRMIQLESIPVTVNGKVNLRLLPGVFSRDEDSAEITPGRHSMDQELLTICSDVLGIQSDQIGIDHSFFWLGGHSLSTIQLISRIRQQMQCDLTIEEVFQMKTVRNFSDYLQQQRKTADEPGQGSQSSAERQHPVYLANSLQQGFVYHNLKQRDFDDAYILQSIHEYRAEISLKHYRKAWESAQRKYCSLRLKFSCRNEIVQIVNDDDTLDFRYVDKDVAISELQQQDRAERYQLEVGRLCRIYLVKHDYRHFSCMFSCHHAIMDGWSLIILYDFVHRKYLELLDSCYDEEPTNDSVETDIDTAYCRAQTYLEHRRLDNVDYWKTVVNSVSDRVDLSNLMNDASRRRGRPLNSYDHLDSQLEKTVVLNGELWDTLRHSCTGRGITVHSALQFVWHKVLHIYGGDSGQQTVTGTVVSGRNIPVDGVENSVGLYINTLPLVVSHDRYRDRTIADVLVDIQRDVMVMNSRSNVELGQLQASANSEDNGAMKHSLFDSLFVLESEPGFDQTDVKRVQDRLQLKRRYQIEKLDYPLVVVARENVQESTVCITLCYGGELLEDERIDEMLNVMLSLFKQISTDFDLPISRLEYVDDTQIEKFTRWNDTYCDFPHVTLNQLFENEASALPDKTAVVFNDVRLTYRQLNERSNQLARFLLSLADIKPNQLIALFLDKNDNMIASIMAVWKAGAAYVPIDPSYPRDRIEFILSDTNARMVITNSRHVMKLKELEENTDSNSSICIVDIESIAEETASTFPRQDLVPIASPTDLAYVIYTSGTTGKPKGVMIEHVGVVNLHMSLRKTFDLKRTDDEVILSFSNYIFDHFVEQMNDALLNGQTLVILDDEMRTDKARLYRYITDNAVTYLSGTPSVLSQYEFDGLGSCLRRIDAVGEDFTESVFDKMRTSFDGLIINGYGPTEISITSHKRLYSRPDERRSNKSIGFPVDNTTCYVLDGDMKLVPIGTTGELYIGGIGVARGYLNRPDLTSQRFVANPFQTDDDRRNGNRNSRLYRTGDLVRWLSNGEIECIGRNDFQVKLRGIRIELGEIETAILSYGGISRCVVTVVADSQATTVAAAAGSQKFLVAYVVPNNGTILHESDIRKHLTTKLPLYMVPNRLVQIPEIPVNVSGKLDTKRLPVVSFAPSSSNSDYVAPSTESEIKMTHIWSDILGIPADNISASDDFFSLGGDSLSSVKLSFAIADVYRVNVGIAAVFRTRTIRDLCRYLQSHCQQSAEVPFCRGDDSAEPSPVSFAQEQLLFIDEFENGTHAYNVPLFFEIKRPVDRTALKHAMMSCIERHQALRTLLPPERSLDGIRLQEIVDCETAERMMTINEMSVHSLAHLDDLLHRESQHVFQLAKELPMRVCFYDLSSTGFYISIVVHHICFDGWSTSVLLRDLKTFYSHFVNNGRSTDNNILPVLNCQYTDYSIWQRRRLTTGNRYQQLSDYWLQKLDGFEPLNMCLDYPRGKQFDYSGRDIQFTVDGVVGDNIRRLARSLKTSVFSVFLSAYCYVLSQFTAQRDIVIGVPVANRDCAVFENLIGFFVNMIVLRVVVKNDSTLADFISDVSHEILQSQMHQDLPFEKLVKLLHIQNDRSRHPIVQVVFGFNNFDVIDSTTTSDLQIADYSPANAHLNTTAKYDIFTSVAETGGQFKCNVNFSTQLFGETTLQYFADSYQYVLEQLASLNYSSISGKKLAQLTCIDQTVSFDFEDRSPFDITNIRTVETTTLHRIFEYSVIQCPDKLALVCGDVEMTYGVLNRRSNQLAHHLHSIADIQPDRMIVLALDKNELMIIAILGAWKAGAAYVPVDPNYPAERIRYILEDTQAQIVITNESYSERIRAVAAGRSVRLVTIDSQDTVESLSQCPIENYDSEVSGCHLAYVIYTSGSTGKPKGVLVEHRNCVSLRNDLKNRYFGQSAVDGDDQAILFLSNYVFDFSIEQLVLSILSSNKLIIPRSNVAIDDQSFYDYANKNKLTYLSGTPTYLHQFTMSRFKHLKMILLAGECVHDYHYDKIRSEFGRKVAVAYGVTETTVYNTVQMYDNKNSVFKNALGQPLSNTRLYIVNDHLDKLPSGAVGELCISGRCVTRGYLNRHDQTSASFVPNPFHTVDERLLLQADDGRDFDRLYRTGDLVRYTHDGRLEYIGRKDMQVKIRGFRIEVGEIESVISSFENVQQCVVVARNRNGPGSPKYLVAYFVTRGGGDRPSYNDDDGRLMALLRQKLPDYMIPTRLIRLDHIPTTVNGKLDVRALPDYDVATDDENRNTCTRPRNDEERQACAILSSMLHVQCVGIDDDFFRLGGDSILSLQLVGELRQKLSANVTVKDVFTCRTIRRIFDHLRSKREQFQRLSGPTGHVVECLTEQGLLDGELPMLPIQKWFFDKRLDNPNGFTMTFSVRLPRSIEVDKLRSALTELIKYHDALRIRFRKSPNTSSVYEQFYQQSVDDVVVHCLDTNDSEFEDKLLGLEESIDISNGPLFVAAFVRGYENGSCRLWLTVHHLVVDTVSWRIITRDLETLYNDRHRTLGPKKTSYRQWAGEIQNYRCSDDDKTYWSRVHEECSRALVADNVLWQNVCTSSVYGRTFVLTREETATLMTASRHRSDDTRVDDLMLTALGQALRSTVTGRSTNWVLMEGHGREQQLEQFEDGSPVDISDTVGWFTTMFPVRLDTPTADNDDDNLTEPIVNVRNSRRRIPSTCHGLGYGALFGYNDRCLPRVTFNYLGRLGTGVRQAAEEEEELQYWVIDSDHVIDAGLPRPRKQESANHAVIDVTALTVDDQLRMNVSSYLDTDRTSRFTSAFHEYLVKIINHTSATPGRSLVNSSSIPASSADSDFIPYFKFNEHLSDTAPVLFVLPPGEGGAESYFQNIVRHLATVRLVVFNNYYRHFNSPSSSMTFEQLAPIYLQHVRRVQPHGPYHFLGWSFGGLLALEMTIQLTAAAAGDRVASLVFVDSYFDVSGACSELGLSGNVLDRIHHVYRPDVDTIRRAVDGGDISNLVLFKACRENTLCRNDEQKTLFDFYTRRTKFNRLDALVGQSSIQIVEMVEDSHVSWTGNTNQVVEMCHVIESRLLLQQLPSSCKRSAEMGADDGRRKTITRSLSSH